MENVKEIVTNNIVKLRKQNKMTQAELAEKLNYSDKAISRWESGEVVPDVETLNKVAGVFNISIGELFNEKLNVEEVKKIDKQQRYSRMAISLLAVSFIWVLVTVVYVYASIIFNENPWQLFIYAVPTTVLVATIFNYIWGTKFIGIILTSSLVWSTLLSVYISFIGHNMWAIFLIGVPMQLAIILWNNLKIKK